MVAVALPLAPLAPGAAAAAGTFVAGSVAYVAQQVYGFRAPLPPLPRVGGKAGGPTLKELVADAIAGARVPVALPPNPLGPRGNWAAIGAGVILGLLEKTSAQVWGLFKQKTARAEPGSYYPEGPLQAAYGNNLRICVAWNNTCAFSTLFNKFGSITYNNPRLSFGVIVYDLYQTVTLANGTQVTEKAQGGFTLQDITRLKVTVMPGVPTIGSVTPPTELVPGTVPEIETEPGKPAPIRIIPLTPEPPKPQPDAEPSVVPVTPGPVVPTKQPLLPRRAVPLRVPGATATKDGTVVPQAPAPIAVTPSDAHFPVPGGAPVLGNGPQPKPEAIAQELGRLEQKLARLSDPGPEGPGDGSDRLQLLSDLIGRLIEFATSMTSGGGYSLSSPCELDENGDRIVSTVNYPGATNSLDVLGNKIDALAGVLQVHKDLKQPNCKQPAAVGQPVTVNFVQVD